MFDNTKEEVANIIIRAEVLADKSGVSVFETLGEYSKELRKNKKKVSSSLKNISMKLERNVKRDIAYRDFFSPDLIRLLKISEEKSILPGIIFQSYSPIKEMADKNISKIKNGLRVPLAMYVLMSVIFSVVVEKFKIINEMFAGKMSSLGVFILNNYVWISIVVFAVIVYSFVMVPHKMPIMGKVFRKLKALMALSSMVTLMDMNYSSSEVIPTLKKQFNLKSGRKKGNLNAKALVEFLKLNDIVNDIEGADIKIGIEKAELKNVAERILRMRVDDVENESEEIKKIIENMGTFLTAIPVVLAMIVLMESLTIVVSQAGGG